MLRESKIKTTENKKPQTTKQPEITTNLKGTTTITTPRPARIGSKETKSSKKASVSVKKQVKTTDIRKFLENKKLEKQKKLETLRTPDAAILAPCLSSNTLNIYQPRSCTDNTHVVGQILIDNIEKSDLSAGGGTRNDIKYED